MVFSQWMNAMESLRNKEDPRAERSRLTYSRYLQLGKLLAPGPGGKIIEDYIRRVCLLSADLWRFCLALGWTQAGNQVLTFVLTLGRCDLLRPTLEKTFGGNAASQVLRAFSEVQLGPVEKGSLQPITELPEERLFIRDIQLHELVWAVTSYILEDAVNRNVEDRNAYVNQAIAALRVANQLLAANAILLPVTEQIPKDIFYSVIRVVTNGASSIQSRSYHHVDRRLPQKLVENIYTAAGLTVEGGHDEQATIACLKSLGGALGDLAWEMEAYDLKLRMWKFGHMKMTREYIGEVPGTGGTSGLSYLAKQYAKDSFGGEGH